MGTTATVGSLNLVTLGIVLVVLIVAFAWFMRKRSNRQGLDDDQGFDRGRMDAAARADTDPPRARDGSR